LSWRYRDWSDEAHRWYARVLVGFCVVCLVFSVVAIALEVYYGSEVLIHRKGVSGTSHYTFDVSTEHIVLALEGDLHFDEMDVDYTIYDTSDGRKVADDTLRVYDEEYEDYWTEVHHHVIKPGRYNLTLVQEPGVSGTFDFFVNQTDLGPHEEWTMEVTLVVTGFGLMCLGGLLLWFAGWRKEKHTEVYARVQIYVWVCIMVLFLPTFAVIII
jgi:hypothetical protein